MRETRWRVVEADGRAYPPNSDPLRSYEVAERRLAYYTKMTRAGGDDARLPKLPLSLEWCQIEVGPWNGVRGGLDLVSPPDPPAASPDERLREALRLIAQHARLDLSERDIAEAERYAVIAEDALASPEGGPTLICALRAGRQEHTPEAEPVLIETVGEAVVFVLDCGERLEFDRVELLSALGSAIAADMGRLRAA